MNSSEPLACWVSDLSHSSRNQEKSCIHPNFVFSTGTSFWSAWITETIASGPQSLVLFCSRGSYSNILHLIPSLIPAPPGRFTDLVLPSPTVSKLFHMKYQSKKIKRKYLVIGNYMFVCLQLLGLYGVHEPVTSIKPDTVGVGRSPKMCRKRAGHPLSSTCIYLRVKGEGGGWYRSGMSSCGFNGSGGSHSPFLLFPLRLWV